MSRLFVWLNLGEAFEKVRMVNVGCFHFAWNGADLFWHDLVNPIQTKL
jgi:hypothetical protein